MAPTSMVYRAHSRTSRATHRDPVLQKEKERREGRKEGRKGKKVTGLTYMHIHICSNLLSVHYIIITLNVALSHHIPIKQFVYFSTVVTNSGFHSISVIKVIVEVSVTLLPPCDRLISWICGYMYEYVCVHVYVYS